jgi:DNA-binding transcriptional LysR family regulator
MSRTRLRRYFRHGLLPQLLVFEAVARLGSVTRAAEELHLAQPTVSMQLKKLSGALDVVLFEQRGRRLYLTAAGHALRASCEELIALLARADERLAPWRGAGTEALRLAAEPEARRAAARLVAAAAIFLREALRLDAPEPLTNNSAAPGNVEGETGEEGTQWKSRATTTRRRT